MSRGTGTPRLRVAYDATADAAYVTLCKSPWPHAETVEAAEDVLLDYDEQGTLEGVELLSPRSREHGLSRIAADHGFAGLLDPIYAALSCACHSTFAGAPMSVTYEGPAA